MSDDTTYTLCEELSPLEERLSDLRADRRALVVSESNCATVCLSRLGIEADVILPAGEAGKTLESLQLLWEKLAEGHFTREDRLIAIGGGALLDVAGLTAATYKRGMRLISVPTTLLAEVDAAIGGKTAIDFAGVKNSIGTFYPAEEVIVCPSFLTTLPDQELLSGWGEVLKYALLGAIPMGDLSIGLRDVPSSLIRRCIEYKCSIVASDPQDRGGQRQYLNLGHTIGHALEARALEDDRAVPHGIAVAAGLVIEGYLSHVRGYLGQDELMRIARIVRDHFPPLAIGCREYACLYDLCRQDKKAHSSADGVPVVLLEAIGKPAPTLLFSQKDIEEGLDFYRDFMHI